MSHSNKLVGFLRHYGPIPAGDNMYDELIHNEITEYGIDRPIKIEPRWKDEVFKNFESDKPKTIILTGTAGDGKTHICRLVWEEFNGSDPQEWQKGLKVAKLQLPNTGKYLNIIKDLSELTTAKKADIMPSLADAIRDSDPSKVYLVAANDGQLLASWREFAELRGGKYREDFDIIERMLVDEKEKDENIPSLLLYNLSHFNGWDCFKEIVTEITEHPLWSECDGCPLLPEDGSTTCPIRINRDRLRSSDDGFSPFRHRLTELLKLARANRMHLPIRDLLLLCVNIILGDRERQGLLTCRKAMNRARDQAYSQTNPYANAFGANLPPRLRQQYQAFSTLEAFGIGTETDNKTDHLLIYGRYDDEEKYNLLVGNDPYYGEAAYKRFLQDYLGGERENLKEFIRSLERQRQRLFFTLPLDSDFSPWALSVYRSSGTFLEFGEKIAVGEFPSTIVELLVRGLNRTFCGMMIDDDDTVYLASSGGDGRARISSILKFEIGIIPNSRNPYIDFAMASDQLTPLMRVVDPTVEKEKEVIDSIELQISHFEYLIRVAKGSLPSSFSRQCYEDFLGFKLRVIEHLDQLFQDEIRSNGIRIKTINVNEHGRPQLDNIRIIGGE